MTSAVRFPAETSLGPPLWRGCGKLIPAYNGCVRRLSEIAFARARVTILSKQENVSCESYPVSRGCNDSRLTAH